MNPTCSPHKPTDFPGITTRGWECNLIMSNDIPAGPSDRGVTVGGNKANRLRATITSEIASLTLDFLGADIAKMLRTTL